MTAKIKLDRPAMMTAPVNNGRIIGPAPSRRGRSVSTRPRCTFLPDARCREILCEGRGKVHRGRMSGLGQQRKSAEATETSAFGGRDAMRPKDAVSCSFDWFNRDRKEQVRCLRFLQPPPANKLSMPPLGAVSLMRTGLQITRSRDAQAAS